MELREYIEHTLLAPEATGEEIKTICKEAIEGKFKGVCVASRYAPLAVSLCQHTPVIVSVVVGFPLGNQATPVKKAEAMYAIEQGADELDMVLAIGAVKEGLWDEVQTDIEEVVNVAKGRAVKVILETALLTKEEIVQACKVAVQAGAQYVKTSTGFSTGGATIEDIKIMKEAVQGKAKIKAAGGIRDSQMARLCIAAGADRIGTSKGPALTANEE